MGTGVVGTSKGAVVVSAEVGLGVDAAIGASVGSGVGGQKTVLSGIACREMTRERCDEREAVSFRDHKMCVRRSLKLVTTTPARQSRHYFATWRGWHAQCAIPVMELRPNLRRSKPPHP